MKRTFRSWLADWLRSNRKEPARFRTERTDRLPRTPKPNVVYQIGDEDCVWSAALRCPCGCGDVIHLSLVTDASPAWRIQKRRNGEITVLPSVWRTVGCRSHFIIYRSRVVWCSDDSPEFDRWRWLDYCQK
jgi:hypothetical protein